MIVGLGFDKAGHALKQVVADHLAEQGVAVKEKGIPQTTLSLCLSRSLQTKSSVES